jgi:hypothetical protein
MAHLLREAFTRASAKPEAPSGIELQEAIFRERPDLRGQTAQFPRPGAKSHVVIIGNEFFKGPVSLEPTSPGEEPRVDFEVECKALKDLEGKGLPIPAITTIGKDYLFLGTTKAPGILMGGDFESKMTTQQQRVLAKDLIDFVIGMANALPAKDGKFAMHDDLWYSNIFIDPATKRLSAVVDFGKVAYKTADEWAPMFDFEGRPFYKMLQQEFDSRRGELPGATAEASKPTSAQHKSILARIRSAAFG